MIEKEGDQTIKISNEKYLLGKSDPKSDIFDVLQFVYRDVKEPIIPPLEKFQFLRESNVLESMRSAAAKTSNKLTSLLIVKSEKLRRAHFFIALLKV